MIENDGKKSDLMDFGLKVFGYFSDQFHEEYPVLFDALREVEITGALDDGAGFVWETDLVFKPHSENSDPIIISGVYAKQSDGKYMLDFVLFSRPSETIRLEASLLEAVFTSEISLDQLKLIRE